jgi:NAD-dependent deacetylase
MNDSISTMASWVAQANRVVVVTGAGISTDSGIPDYRGPQGVWTKNPKAEKMSDITFYISDPEVRQLAWQSRLNSPAWTAIPNRGHQAIVRIHEVGKLHALVTQNIDGLHQHSGVPSDKVIEVHGTIRQSVCWGCGDKRDMLRVLERVRAGEVDPPCELCGGILKSDTISFGQALVPEVIDAAMRVSEQADVMLAIGSTLSVSPANQVVPRARAAGALVGIINGQETAMDHYAQATHVGDIATALWSLLREAGLTPRGET